MSLVYSMSAPAVQTIELNQEKVFSHHPGDCLAFVDLETYPAYVAKKVDRLDMMAHFSRQMQALTALSWKAPETAQRLRLLVTENDFLVERLGRTSPAQIASGNLRTYGQICLATHAHFFDCAKHRTHGLLRSVAKTPPPQVLNVPPGVYAITMYYDAPFHLHLPESDRVRGGAEIDYTIILRHYPFPPPRVAPTRLSAGFFSKFVDEATRHAWDHVTSHKSPA